MQTECPNCRTLFRVTEAQLDMANGMVRCGFCKHVFDARAEKAVGENGARPEPAEQALPEDDLQRGDTGYTDEPAYDALAPDVYDEPDSLASDEAAVNQYAPSYSTASTVAWSLAILALIATLTVEYIWFNHPELLQHQGLKPLTEKICAVTDCAHLQKRDPSQIEMVSRNVFTHPNQKDALMISTTLVNHASYSQPYPDVQIDFSNVRGELIASRRFLPEEYLQLDSDSIGLIEAGAQVAFGLEIRDPGREAITYEFSFH